MNQWARRPWGEQAIVLAEQLRPDLVLMDIQLAGEMEGIAAAQAIRERFAIPVVFLTAFAGDTILERAKVTEPFGYIIKPFQDREAAHGRRDGSLQAAGRAASAQFIRSLSSPARGSA